MLEQVTELFGNSLVDVVNIMADQQLEIIEHRESSSVMERGEPGVVSIVGFSSDKTEGRSMLWVSKAAALTLAEKVSGAEADTYLDDMVLFTVAELNNMLSGQSTTFLNNKYDLSLRLSPPSIIAGEEFSMETPALKSRYIRVELFDQPIILDIALKEGEEAWTE